MPELIPAGSGETAWFDITVTQGSPRAIFLKSASGNVPAPAGIDFALAHKTPDNRYVTLVNINASNINTHGHLSAAGVYGLKRLASAVSDSIGADIEGA